MRQEHQTEVLQAHRDALEADEESRHPHEMVLGILSALATWEITVGQALRLLGFQATRLAREPAKAALYRQAAADLRQMRAWGAVNRPNLDDAGT